MAGDALAKGGEGRWPVHEGMQGQAASVEGAPIDRIEGKKLIEPRQSQVWRAGAQEGRAERLLDRGVPGAKAVRRQQRGQGGLRSPGRKVFLTRPQVMLPGPGRVLIGRQGLGDARLHGRFSGAGQKREARILRHGNADSAASRRISYRQQARDNSGSWTLAGNTLSSRAVWGRNRIRMQKRDAIGSSAELRESCVKALASPRVHSRGRVKNMYI